MGRPSPSSQKNQLLPPKGSRLNSHRFAKDDVAGALTLVTNGRISVDVVVVVEEEGVVDTLPRGINVIFAPLPETLQEGGGDLRLRPHRRVLIISHVCMPGGTKKNRMAGDILLQAVVVAVAVVVVVLSLAPRRARSRPHHIWPCTHTR